MYTLIYNYFKFILLAAFIAILAGVIGYEITQKAIFYTIWNKATFLFTVMGIYFLHTTGNFIKSEQYKTSKIAVSVLIVGIIFKIIHWPFSEVIIAFGIILIWSFYLFYMFKNKVYKWTNWLTLLLLITVLSDRYLIFANLHVGNELMIVSMVLLLILLTFRLKDIKDQGLDKI